MKVMLNTFAKIADAIKQKRMMCDPFPQATSSSAVSPVFSRLMILPVKVPGGILEKHRNVFKKLRNVFPKTSKCFLKNFEMFSQRLRNVFLRICECERPNQ